jgi:hypothetical protein
MNPYYYFRRMIIKIFNVFKEELKKNIQKPHNEYQESTHKNS